MAQREGLTLSPIVGVDVRCPDCQTVGMATDTYSTPTAARAATDPIALDAVRPGMRVVLNGGAAVWTVESSRYGSHGLQGRRGRMTRTIGRAPYGAEHVRQVRA